MFDLTIQDFNGEPRMRDIEIAGALGYDRPRKFRDLISRNLVELAEFGGVNRPTPGRLARPGPNVPEYWLNEHQCFYLCTQSKAKKAFEVTRHIINLFVAWRNGRITPPEVPAEFQVTPDTLTHLALVREVRLTKGIAAAQVIYDHLPLPSLVSDPLTPPTPSGDEVSILLFLQDECVISGDPGNWMRARDLYSAYLAYCANSGRGPFGKRRFGNQLRAVAEVFRCPSGGGRFWPAKRSDTGFCGIRLIAHP